ncbi:MAG: DNA-binding protein [Candidatus Micrarchaeia archaeon]|jgi:DNA-binding TFAR19-related protein (PDSD5 family)
MEDHNDLLEKVKKEQLIKMEMSKILEPKAYERLMNVRISNEKKYFSVVALLLQYSKQLNGKQLNDEELMKILQSFQNNYEPKFEVKR